MLNVVFKQLLKVQPIVLTSLDEFFYKSFVIGQLLLLIGRLLGHRVCVLFHVGFSYLSCSKKSYIPSILYIHNFILYFVYSIIF